MKHLFFFLLMMSLSACNIPQEDNSAKLQKLTGDEATAMFAGGCFWCTESDFESLNGVKTVISGYAGGDVENPSYKDVSSGSTGHREVVQVYYDPDVVTYRELVDFFWKIFDPTDDGGSFGDRGHQYTSAVFYGSEEEKDAAEASKRDLQKSGVFDKPIVTPILPAPEFYPAEDYHQDYYKKNPLRYKFYRKGSGRDDFIENTWQSQSVELTETAEPDMPEDDEEEEEAEDFADAGSQYQKPSDEELRQMLTPLQYKVTQQDGTERPFENEYNDNKAEGIYVDIVSGEPLFSSTHKYDSKTGWPSFWQPLVPENIVEKEDRKLFVKRTEIRSKNADSHLGHVFTDGPEPTGLRYCMNSAALRFIPKEELEEEGHSQFMNLFE